MYRLFVHRTFADYFWRNWSRTHTGCHSATVTCSCRYRDSDIVIGNSSVLSRRQLTTLNALPVTFHRKRRRFRRQRKYAELIEVTRNSSSQKRAEVSQLEAHDLNILVYAEETSSILPKYRNYEGIKGTSELHSIPHENTWEVKHDELLVHEVSSELAEHDMEILSEQADPAHFLGVDVYEGERIEKNFEQCENFSERHSLPTSLFTSETQEKNKKDVGKIFPRSKKRMLTMKKHLLERAKKAEANSKILCRDDFHKTKFSKYELAAYEESFIQSLLSYIDTCVNCGFLSRGMNALMFYRARGKRYDGNGSFRVRDVRVYEALLQGYAAKKNLSKIEELMQAMNEDGIIITPQCYAACFECIGRRSVAHSNITKEKLRIHVNHKFSGKIKLIQLLTEMSDKGITLNDLFAKTCLLSDQKMMVMESVLRIDPNFSPVWPSCPEVGYTCRLLEGLNHSQTHTYSSPVSGLFTSKQLQEFSLEQLQTELKDCLEVKSVEIRGDPNETVLHFREKLAETQEEWRKVITNAISRDLQTLQHRSQRGVIAHRYMNLYPFLVSLNRGELVELVLQEIRKLAEGSETFSPTTNQLYRELGSRVLERYRVLWKEKTGILDKVKHLYDKYCDWFAAPENITLSEKTVTCTRQAWQSLVYSHQDEGSSLNFRERSWPVSVQIGVGKFLYDIIIREIRIDINISRPGNKKCHLLPAFYTLFRSQQQGKMIKEEVKPHPVLARLFRGAASDTLQFPAKCVPMLCPPTPWTTVTSGAYLLTKADVIRLPQQASMQWNRLVNCPTQQLYPALDSLNQLGAVPWRVNKQVLDVVMEVFNTGGSSRLAIPAPPSSYSSIPMPEAPCKSAADPISGQSNELNSTAEQEKVKLHRQHLYLRRKKAEAYSLWCDMHYRLSLANHFRDRVFWLPHNMDFRGRVYPCPPHLNHLGSDVARSLLCFAKGQPLGPKGLDWLKLHVVNLTGVMKRNPIKERMAFAEEMMPQILDSAEKPLTGEMWWSKSEEPWQTLAACMEINSALKAQGGPEKYVCHFPVHQDGSCNGLQHYAALGRDSAGAASVSMAPSECPQDVYGVVAAMVERERQADAKLGISVAQILDGFVRRKVIKQTVMTTVYGVTRFGARLQIARQLRDIDEFPKEYVWRASSYLVGKTFGSLREMFTSTKEIQDWFTECARLISQVCGRSVEWVTPLGLPVVQPYHRIIGSKRQGSADPLSVGYMKVPYGVVGYHERPNVMKQKNAFPPNFIHSIDSSHMMLTSLWCEREGLTFVSVHDCYWTHPSTVETMNQICREQFVALHSEPILEDLSTFLFENYGFSEEDYDEEVFIMDSTKKKLNEVLTQVPKKGDFDLKRVLNSVYFFS